MQGLQASVDKGSGEGGAWGERKEKALIRRLFCVIRCMVHRFGGVAIPPGRPTTRGTKYSRSGASVAARYATKHRRSSGIISRRDETRTRRPAAVSRATRDGSNDAISQDQNEKKEKKTGSKTDVQQRTAWRGNTHLVILPPTTKKKPFSN